MCSDLQGGKKCRVSNHSFQEAQHSYALHRTCTVLRIRNINTFLTTTHCMLQKQPWDTSLPGVDDSCCSSNLTCLLWLLVLVLMLAVVAPSSVITCASDEIPMYSRGQCSCSTVVSQVSTHLRVSANRPPFLTILWFACIDIYRIVGNFRGVNFFADSRPGQLAMPSALAHCLMSFTMCIRRMTAPAVKTIHVDLAGLYANRLEEVVQRHGRFVYSSFAAMTPSLTKYLCVPRAHLVPRLRIPGLVPRL